MADARPPEAAYAKLQSLGFSEFRGIQEQAIGALCSGRDVFGMMATSGGKSLCYTIPAAIAKGYALIVSPLISLMNDQASGMMEKGIPALAMTSLSLSDKIEAIASAGSKVKCLLMSPEMMGQQYIKDALRANPPDFVAFDEAHCISTWGADFRPDYMAVGSVLKDISPDRHIPRIGLTATASEEAIEECLHYGGFADPVVIRQSLARNNIGIFVKPSGSIADTDQAILNDVRYFSGASGIIYCQRRREVDRLYELLKDAGYPCHRHHSGMKTDERRDNAIAFMRDQSCMVATMGFGMGIDKPDVRYVIHQELSPTPEGWFQEMGRGGRDGKPAVSITYIQPGFTQAVSLANVRRQMAWQVSKNYAQVVLGGGCRMQGVLSLFGETSEPCGRCDACLARNTDASFPSRASYEHTLSSDILTEMRQCDATPGKFARYKGAEAEWKAIEDALFAGGLIDYVPVIRPSGPPSARMTMTEEAFSVVGRGLDIECSIPDMSIETAFSRDIKGTLDLIATRSWYEGYAIDAMAKVRILNTRPDRETLQMSMGIPKRIAGMLSNSDIPGLQRTSLSQGIQNTGATRRKPIGKISF